MNPNTFQKLKQVYDALGIWIALKVITLSVLVLVSAVVFVSGLNVRVAENPSSYNVQGNYFYNTKLLSPPYFKPGGEITFFSQFYLSKNFHENNSFVYMLSNNEDRRIFAVNETYNGIKYMNIKAGDNFTDYIRLDIPESFQKNSYDISVGFAYDEQPLDEIIARDSVENLFIKVFTIYRVSDARGMELAFASVVLVLSLAGLSITLGEVLLPRSNVNILLALTGLLMSIGIVFATMIVTFSFTSSMWTFGRVIIPEYLFIFTIPLFIVMLLYSFLYLILARIDAALYLTIGIIMFLAILHINISVYQGNRSANMLDLILSTDDFFKGMFNDKANGIFNVSLFVGLVMLTLGSYRRTLFASTFTLRFYLATGMLITNIALYSMVEYVLGAYSGVSIIEVMNQFEFYGLFLPYFTTYINL